MTKFRSLPHSNTRVFFDLDLETPGKRFSELRLKYSDNETALGYIPIPIGVIVNGEGPTLLLIGGVHGDEFEGPVAILKLLHQLDHHEITGRIIGLPALNTPALKNSSRVSPIDNGNLNRAFPGDPDGTPTWMIADFIENTLMKICDAVIDLHAGGKAAWFAPCTMAIQNENEKLSKANLDLAEVFNSSLIWLMGRLNDDRSVNQAALRNNIPMIAAELGGGGQITPKALAVGEQGLRNCLHHLGILKADTLQSAGSPRYFVIRHHSQHVYSPKRGLFEPMFEPGDFVHCSDLAGCIYDTETIDNSPVFVAFEHSGIAFTRCHRGMVERGEQLAIVGSLVDRPVF